VRDAVGGRSLVGRGEYGEIEVRTGPGIDKQGRRIVSGWTCDRDVIKRRGRK